MDYFSDLLNSYDKLKKRTFKLRYISEAEAKKEPKKEEPQADASTLQKAEGVANDAISSAPAIDSSEIAVRGLKVMNVLGKPTGMIVYKNQNNGSVGVQGLGPQGGVLSIDKYMGKDAGGQPKLQRNQEAFRQFVEKIAAEPEISGTSQESIEQDVSAEEQLAQQEAMQAEAEKEARRTIGGWSELNEVPLDPATKKALENAQSAVTKYCDNNKDTEALEPFCRGSWQYFAAGERNIGIEYKLGTAQGLEVTDPEDGLTRRTDISPVLKAEAAKSFELLVSFLNDSNEDKCEEITKRVGVYKKNKLVLFGAEPNEGVVINTNGLTELALNRVESECPDVTRDSLTQLVGDGFSDKQKNAVKGTFYEAIMAFQARVIAGDPEGAKEDLMMVIEENRAIIKAIFADRDPEAGQGLDEAFDNSVQEDMLGWFSDDALLEEGLRKEIASTQKFVAFMGADGVQSIGKASRTGDRADLQFTYKDKSVAEKKAEAIGSSVEELEDGTYGVGIGLKRQTALHGAKFGEINSMTRMLGLITGDIKNDRNVHPGFEASIQRTQFGGPNTTREEDMVSFARELEEEIVASTAQLIEDKTYTDADGKIKSQTPEGVLRVLGDTVRKMLSLPQQNNSIVMKAFYDKNADGDWTLKDFEGDGDVQVENRERAREMVSRTARFNKLSSAVEAGDQRARDYLLKSMLVCGSNANDLGQVIVDDNGDSITVKHNEVFKIICDAENDPDPEQRPSFKFSQSGVQICARGLCVSYNQEGTSASGNRRETRSALYVSKSTLQDPRIAGDVSTSQNNSTLHKYFEGQMKLLEELINQTT